MWKSMKTWQKVVAVILVLFAIRGCALAAKGDSEKSVAVKPAAEVKPHVGFMIEDTKQDLIATFECRPDQPGKGYEIVFRNHAGDLVDGTGISILYHVQAKGGQQTLPWKDLTKTDTGEWPKADGFMYAAFTTVSKIPQSDNLEFVFIMVRDNSEIRTARRFTMGAITVATVSAGALQQPCSVIPQK